MSLSVLVLVTMTVVAVVVLVAVGRGEWLLLSSGTCKACCVSYIQYIAES